MGNIVKIAKKFLMSGPFYNDGFEYQFISVEDDLYDAIKFTVNVLLPKKGQSFVVEKFSYDIADIIENMSKSTANFANSTRNLQHAIEAVRGAFRAPPPATKTTTGET